MKNQMKNLMIVLFVLGIVSLAHTASAQTYYTNNGMTTQQNSQTYTSVTSSVDLNASVNPGGYTTTAWFEYGTDANFYAFNETEHIFIGAGYSDMPVAVTINNLTPNTMYYFRVITNNGRNTIKGNVLTFMTNQNQNTQSTLSNTNSTRYVSTNTNYINRYVNTTTPTYTNQTSNNTQLYTTPVYSTAPVTYSNSVVANPLFGTTFLPSNVFDWLILLILIFAIVWVIRRLSQPTTYVIQK